MALSSANNVISATHRPEMGRDARDSETRDGIRMSATTDPRLGNLPHEITSFVGRRVEVAETKRLLSLSRLTTVTGEGGVGKSRLALRVAVQVRRAFEGGVWWVELSQHRTSSSIVSAISEAIGLVSTTEESEGKLVDYLSDRSVLLVLDCCEASVDSLSELCVALLKRCPFLRILTTSRQTLGIVGEAVLAVPALAVPRPDQVTVLDGLPQYDAVTLFAERAATVVPDFEVNETNQSAVAQICITLEGLPLAIESAATRLRVMSAEQILRRLSDRLRLLSLGNRGGPARHQTLRSCVDWSFELCSTAEQALWSRLAIFEGSFDLDAAESICSDFAAKKELVDLITGLVDKSILSRDATGPVVRYRLSETLRDYGKRRIQGARAWDSLSRRHRDWFLRLALRAAADWGGPNHGYWCETIVAENQNLCVALDSFINDDANVGRKAGLQLISVLCPFWCARGLFTEVRRWIDKALTKAVNADEDRARALCAATTTAAVQGDRAGVVRYTDQLRAFDCKKLDPDGRSYILYASGCRALVDGQFLVAQAQFKEAIACPRQRMDLATSMWSLLGIAISSGLTGDTARLQPVLVDATRNLAGVSTDMCKGWMLWIAGFVSFHQGDLVAADRMIKDALRFDNCGHDLFFVSGCLEVAAWIATGQQQSRRAALLMGAASMTTGLSPSPIQRLPQHESSEQQIHRALGDKAAKAALADGRRESLDSAIAFACSDVRPRRSTPSRLGTELTQREYEVAALISKGMTNREIASALVVAQRTAQGHVERVLSKLGFSSRSQIAAWIVERENQLALA